MITLSSGVNTLSKDWAGRTVAEVVSLVEAAFGLEGEEVVKVNGVEVNAENVLENGDAVEFVKEAGRKGSEEVETEVKVTVSHGVNTLSVSVKDGSPISSMIDKLQDALGIDTGANTIVKVNGEQATVDTVLHSGDQVEVTKEAGRKG